MRDVEEFVEGLTLLQAYGMWPGEVDLFGLYVRLMLLEIACALERM